MIQFREKLRTDRMTEWQTDEGHFIEHQSAKAGVQQEAKQNRNKTSKPQWTLHFFWDKSKMKNTKAE